MPTMKEVTSTALAARKKAGTNAALEVQFAHMFMACFPLFMAPVVGPTGRDGKDGKDGARGPRGPAGPPGNGGGVDAGVAGVAAIFFENADDPRIKAFAAEAAALAKRELEKLDDGENEASPVPQDAS